jgi:hypothetical protein
MFCVVSIDALIIKGKYLRKLYRTLTARKTKHISVLIVSQTLDKHDCLYH